MNLFQKITLWFQNLWQSTENMKDVNIDQEIAKQKVRQKQLRASLAELIFRKKQIDQKICEETEELQQLDLDVRQASAAGRDDLAMHLLEKQTSVEEELSFLKQQVLDLDQDIKDVREFDKNLAKAIYEAETLKGSLTSRRQALAVRKQISEQMEAIRRPEAALRLEKVRQPLFDQIAKLEAEIEATKVPRESWQDDWHKLRQDRKKTHLEARLQSIKDKQIALPTAAVGVPS